MTTKIISIAKTQITKGYGRYANNVTRILNPKEVKDFISMPRVLINTREMVIRRPSMFDSCTISTNGPAMSIPYNEELDGEYELVRIDEDTIQLKPVMK